MPRGTPTAHRPRPFAMKFERGTWLVQQGDNWRRAKEVSILSGVGVITLASGVIVGEGVVTRTGPQTFAVTP